MVAVEEKKKTEKKHALSMLYYRYPVQMYWKMPMPIAKETYII